MAVREIKNPDSLKMNVFMKDGREFLGCDLTLKPMGETERAVGFWHNDVIKMVPLVDVLHVEFYEELED